ncbi:hypothetical protein, partial [Escherichia coli]|uniref:hypothetical protein n=1 Tax=Escherichia coli TaxID=562 RepID=UPI0019540858
YWGAPARWKKRPFYSSQDRVFNRWIICARPGKNSRPGAAISVTQRERLFHYALPLFPLAKLPIIPAALPAVYCFL